MNEKIYSFTVRHPIWMALISIFFVVAAGAGAKHLTFEDDYRIFFSDDDPKVMAYEMVQNNFSESHNIAFILAPEEGDVFSEDMLPVIRELTEAAWQISYSSRVDSITNFQHTWSEDDDLIVEDLFYEDTSTDAESLKRIKDIALNEPLLVKKLVSPQGHVTVVNVTFQFPRIGLETEVVAEVRKLQAEFTSKYPELDIMLTGMVMLNNSFGEAGIHDNSTLVPLMFLVVLVLMMLLLRNFSGILATIVIVVVSIVSALGLTGWVGIALSGPSAASPIIILTLAVADCIHILSSMFFEMRRGTEKREALLDSIRINFQPVLLTSVTTAIGFLSMNFSEAPPFRDLGNIVAMGVMLACVFSLTLFPALLMILPVKVKKQADTKKDFMVSLAKFVTEKRKVLLPVMSIIIVGLVALLPKNTLDDNFVEYFDHTTEIRQSTDFLQDNLSGAVLMEVAIDSGESGGISENQYLEKLEAFSAWFVEQPEVDHLSTLSDTLKRLNKNMHGDDPSYYRLPDEKEMTAQYLLLYEMSLPYGLDLTNQINLDKSATRILATLNNPSSTEILALEQRIKQWFEGNAPDMTMLVTGPDVLLAHIGQNNIKSMLSGIAIALVLIAILIGFALRSFRFAVISLVPNMAPAAMGFGAWYLLGGQVGLGLSVVAGMTLGIVVDYTVHFLSKYLHARRNKQADTEAAVRYAFGNVGRALWVTTIVLVAGFSVMAQSVFKMNADMGFLTAVTIFIALIVDFFFLPPLLMVIDGKKGRQ